MLTFPGSGETKMVEKKERSIVVEKLKVDRRGETRRGVVSVRGIIIDPPRLVRLIQVVNDINTGKSMFSGKT